MKRLTPIVALLLVVTTTAAWAQRDNSAPKVNAILGVGTGTVQYDPGAPQDFFRGFDGVNRAVGNQFDTANGQPLMAGTLSAATIFPVANGGLPDVILSFFGAPVGGTAPIVGIVYASGVANSTFNIVNLTQAVGSNFLAGMYIGTFGSGPDSIGMRNASTNGQGFHGMQINFAGSVGTQFQTLPDTNAMFRVSGTVVPVELMNFSIE